MIQRLFIAEKPSLGKAIAVELGVTQTCQGYIVCGNDAVTWCFGHLLEQYDPDDYDEAWKLWRRSSLPMIPREWRLKPKESTRAQLQVISNLLGEAATVVNTGTRTGKANSSWMKSSNTSATPARFSASGWHPSIPSLSKKLWQH